MPENGYNSSKLWSQGVIKSLLFISQVSKDILNDAIFIWIFNDTINNSVSRVFFLPGRCRTYVVLLTMYYIVMKNRITSSQFAEQVGYKYFNSHRFWTVYSTLPMRRRIYPSLSERKDKTLPLYFIILEIFLNHYHIFRINIILYGHYVESEYTQGYEEDVYNGILIVHSIANQ